jgi:hypothetical protein
MIFMMGSEALQAGTIMCPAMDTIKIEQVAGGYRYTGTSTGDRTLIFSGMHPRRIPLTSIGIAEVEDQNGTLSLVCDYSGYSGGHHFGGQEVVELKSSDAGAINDCRPDRGIHGFQCRP